MSVNPQKYAISVPFNFTNTVNVNGVVKSVGMVELVSTDDPKYWRDKVIGLLSTNSYERIWYPVYGASLAEVALFENSEEAVDRAVAAISETFIRWLPLLKFKSLDANYDSQTGALTLTVNYKIPTGEDDYAKISVGSSNSETASVIWNG